MNGVGKVAEDASLREVDWWNGIDRRAWELANLAFREGVRLGDPPTDIRDRGRYSIREFVGKYVNDPMAQESLVARFDMFLDEFIRMKVRNRP